MSRKHNTKHTERGTSNYPERLKKRGYAKALEMESLTVLRARQARRQEETGSPYWTFSGTAETEDAA